MQVTELLAELIARPSLNPGDTDDLSLVGEERVAAFLEYHLGGLGFSVERIPYQDGRDNVLARFGCDGAERVLLVEGHMDTVAVDGMVVPPFEATMEGGRLYGRGACDTKGPMAAALAGLTPRVLEAARTGRRGLMFIGACAEEKGCLGAASLAAAGIGADEAIVLEPTDLVPVIAHKGTLWFRIRLTGRACHGSEPENGINAVDAMCELAHFFRESLRFAESSDPLLGGNTLNIGKMQGGRAANIVPDFCEMEVDLRTVPAERHAPLIAQVRAKLDALKAAGRVLDFEVQDSACSSFSTSPASELVQRMKRSAPADPVGTGWMSDACPLAATCPQIAVFGPGSIRQAHTKDEFIELEALHRGVEVFEAIYLDFLG